MMRTIIAGSRGVTDYRVVCDAVIASCFDPTVILSGTARGVDRLGEEWATKHKVPIERYPANWEKDGKAAGYYRNTLMSFLADALIAIWDGKSRGTKHMIDLAKQKGMRVYVHKV